MEVNTTFDTSWLDHGYISKHEKTCRLLCITEAVFSNSNVKYSKVCFREILLCGNNCRGGGPSIYLYEIRYIGHVQKTKCLFFQNDAVQD